MTQLNLLKFQDFSRTYCRTSNGSWFDEKDYFEFFPLHVLHKTKGAARRRKITTKEGIYDVNLNPKKIEKVRSI